MTAASWRACRGHWDVVMSLQRACENGSFFGASRRSHTGVGVCRGKRDPSACRRNPAVGRRAVRRAFSSSEELNLSAHVLWFETVTHELEEAHNFPD